MRFQGIQNKELIELACTNLGKRTVQSEDKPPLEAYVQSWVAEGKSLGCSIVDAELVEMVPVEARPRFMLCEAMAWLEGHGITGVLPKGEPI